MYLGQQLSYLHFIVYLLLFIRPRCDSSLVALLLTSAEHTTCLLDAQVAILHQYKLLLVSNVTRLAFHFRLWPRVTSPVKTVRVTSPVETERVTSPVETAICVCVHWGIYYRLTSL